MSTAPEKIPYSKMTAEQRREYHREAQRRYRQRNPDRKILRPHKEVKSPYQPRGAFR